MGVHCLPAGHGQEGGAKHRETDVGSCVEEVAHRTERAERNRMAAARKIPQRPRTPMTVNHSSIAACERVGEAAASDGPAQDRGETTAPEGLFGERTTRTVQGDRDLPPLPIAGSATGSNGATHKESGSRARSFPARQPRRYVRARIGSHHGGSVHLSLSVRWVPHRPRPSCTRISARGLFACGGYFQTK